MQLFTSFICSVSLFLCSSVLVITVLSDLNITASHRSATSAWTVRMKVQTQFKTWPKCVIFISSCSFPSFLRCRLPPSNRKQALTDLQSFLKACHDAFGTLLKLKNIYKMDFMIILALRCSCAPVAILRAKPHICLYLFLLSLYGERPLKTPCDG